jgi:hypothetical protein
MNRRSGKQAGSPKNGVRRAFEAVTRTAKGDGGSVSRRMLGNGEEKCIVPPKVRGREENERSAYI